MLDEIGSKGALCPDTKEIVIEGNLFLLSNGTSTFSALISQTDIGKTSVNLLDTIIQSQVMTRYFNPEEYNEQGYSTPVIKSVSDSFPRARLLEQV